MGPLFPSRIRWSNEFVLLDMDTAVLDLLRLLETDEPPYIVLRSASDRLYVLTGDELRTFPGIKQFQYGPPPPSLLIAQQLELLAGDSSRRVGRDGTSLDETHPDGPEGRRLPSRHRWVRVNERLEPLYVGEDEGDLTLGTERLAREVDSSRSALGLEPPLGTDEGTNPIRYPSIEADRQFRSDDAVVVTVDLLRHRTARDTKGDGVEFNDLPDDWRELDVDVELVSSAIDFDQPTGTIKVRRNAASVGASFNGIVRADRAAKVVAIFSLEGRDCGMAYRTFRLDASVDDAPPQDSRLPLKIETRAEAPALTVRILRTNLSGQFQWSLTTPRADVVPGLPRRLSETVDIGHPAALVADMYRDFEKAEIGTHEDLFRAKGDELWLRAPESFRRAYWAIRGALGLGFPIQFVTDDPFVPWELMRPYDERTDTTANLLALDHPVARWIADHEGALTQELSIGRVVTVAPNYPSVSDQLERAKEETECLVADYRAVSVRGTIADFKNLLQNGLADERVAVLHFAGHGDFRPNQAGGSSIKLEDGSFVASRAGAHEVKLGDRDAPLVVFNACNVGATGESMGAYGGWAEVFLRRNFRGFIAPLWPVYDDDAPTVVKELFEAIITRREPVGRALQQIRVKHGSASQTFLAYVYYGDVLARMAPAATADQADTRRVGTTFVSGSSS